MADYPNVMLTGAQAANMVTEDEVVDARLGGLNNVAPPWAQGLINQVQEVRNEVRQQRNEVRQQRNEMSEQINEMRNEMKEHINEMIEQIQNLTRGSQLLDLNMKNMIRRLKNKDFFVAQSHGDINCEFLPILKTVPGTRSTMLRGGSQLLQHNIIEMGESSIPFPKTFWEVFEMNQNKIETLAYVYNEDFGILQEDDIREQRNKMLRWIIEYPV